MVASLHHAARAPLGRLLSSVRVPLEPALQTIRVAAARHRRHDHVAAPGADRPPAAEDALALAVGVRADGHVDSHRAGGAQYVRAAEGDGDGLVALGGGGSVGGDGGGGGGAGGCVDGVVGGDALDADLAVADWALHDGLGGGAVRLEPLDDLGERVFHWALLGDLAAGFRGGRVGIGVGHGSEE